MVSPKQGWRSRMHLLVVCFCASLKGGLDGVLEEAVQLLQACDHTPGPQPLQLHAAIPFASVELAFEGLKHLCIGKEQI